MIGNTSTEEQAELLKVKLDGVGKAARKYKDAIDTYDAASESKGVAMENLIDALKRAKKTSIQCEGWKFDVAHTGPKDTIRVHKAQ
jgi:hypothetical protein